MSRKKVARELLKIARRLVAAPKLTEDQIKEVQAEIVPSGVPVRFLSGGKAINIETGQQVARGSNILYHPVYWGFTKETAKKIADWLGVKVVFHK